MPSPFTKYSDLWTIKDPAERIRQSIIRRIRIRNAIHTDEQRDRVRFACAHDPVTFINDWVWTYDPRQIMEGLPAWMPFDLFPKQVDFIRWLHEHNQLGQPGLVEKSRDEGLSWMVSAYLVHQFLFNPGFAGGIGSQKEDKVDKKGDPNTLFAKIRYAIKSLPPWLLPPSFDVRRDSAYMKISNPSNGSSIVGEAGDNMGRGGRYTFYFGDEWAFVPRASTPKRAINGAARTFIRGSTPNGPSGDFAEDRFSGMFDVFTIHWTEDPRKGPEWYEHQKNVMFGNDPVGLAQEVDIDYFASVEGAFFPSEWIRSAIDAEDVLEMPREGKCATGLDVAGDGSDMNAMVSRQGPVVVNCETWPGEFYSMTTDRALEECQRNGSEIFYYDGDGVGAGVTGKLEGRDVPCRVYVIRSGRQPSRSIFSDDKRKRAKDRFKNMRAELHWSFRLRLYKTHRMVNGEEDYPIDECVSIPNNREMIAQLSSIKRVPNETGKIQVESKKDMRKRGVKSPDQAEALIYAFCHLEPKTGGGGFAAER